ncbi:MAG: hypothetical protein IT377_15380 [Polyangiaceae bacterium]|nr:hypothetical protein [Polyangiaceae bacterium]
MNPNDRLTEIGEALLGIERELDAQRASWEACLPELVRAGDTQLWLESLPEAPPAQEASPFLLGTRV